MSADRFREIYEEKAQMQGGLVIGGAPKGRKCACNAQGQYKCPAPVGAGRRGGYKPKKGPGAGQYRECSRTGTASRTCQAAKENPWVTHVRIEADANHNGNYAAALADPATRASYVPLSAEERQQRLEERQGDPYYPQKNHRKLRNYPYH